MTIDLNQPLELVCNGRVVNSYTPTVVGTYYNGKSVAVRWGESNVMITGFNLEDGSYDTGEGEDLILRNVKREPVVTYRRVIFDRKMATNGDDRRPDDYIMSAIKTYKSTLWEDDDDDNDGLVEIKFEDGVVVDAYTVK